MFTTVLPAWSAALLLSVSCWGMGSLLVSSKHPLVRMLAGWGGFLFLCTIPWMVGLSAHAVRPLFWAFFVTGIFAVVRGRQWPELICAIFVTGSISLMLGAPYYLFKGLLAYGANGTDMWGYVTTAEWLYQHSPRDLPVPGHVAMRFNWPWYVLTIRERPLLYESLACLGSSTGVTAVQAYFAYPVVLMSSVAMAVCREPRVFRLRSWIIALPLAVTMVFHPLIVLHWIAGFVGGVIVGPLIALAFAGVVVAEEGPPRTEALTLGLLMIFLCAGLYAVPFLKLGVGFAAILALTGGFALVRRKGLDGLLAERPGPRVVSFLAASVVVALTVLIFSRDDFVDQGHAELTRRFVGQFLGVFGASSPYAWLEYQPLLPSDLDPVRNPLGLAALLGMAVLLGIVSWQRWRDSRDIRLPLIVAICVAGVWHVGRDIHSLAKAMPIFGFTLLVVLAAVSSELRHWALGLAAAIVCCMSGIRSAPEMSALLHGPGVTQREDNMQLINDADDWRILAYLYFREDTEGFDWSKTPKMYFSVTCFLPGPVRQRLAQKYHMPPP
jgi:hypothetical protein